MTPENPAMLFQNLKPRGNMLLMLPSVRVRTQIIPSHTQRYVHVFLSQHSSLLGLTLSLSVI